MSKSTSAHGAKSGKRIRPYLLLGLISVGIVAVVGFLLTTLTFTSAGLLAIRDDDNQRASGFTLLPLPTSASIAQVPEQFSPLAPTSTPSGSSFFQGGQSAGLVVPEREPISPPGQLIIPGLDLEENVQTLLLSGNSWDIQALGSGIGLLEATGRYPGDNFSMVFAGHVSTDWSFWGPFAALAELELGSQINYEWEGHRYIYEIVGSQTIQPTDGKLLFQENKESILLLTCIDYDPLTGEYAERLLVEAKLVDKLKLDQ